MLLDLSRIRTPQERFEQVYPSEAFAEDREDFRVSAPVSLAFDIFKDKALYRLVGRTQTTLELPCSRCLETIAVAVDVPFDLRYQPHVSDATGHGKDDQEDDRTCHLVWLGVGFGSANVVPVSWNQREKGDTYSDADKTRHDECKAPA